MRSRWLLLLALGFGVTAAACGPDKTYCHNQTPKPDVCRSTQTFDAQVPDEQEELPDTGVTVVNP